MAEIRAKNPERHYPAEYGGGVVADEMRTLADRIEAAYTREDGRTARRFAMYAKVNEKQDMDYIALKEENARLREEAQRDIDTVSDDYGRLARELRAENNRLRAALRPVLECDAEVKHYETMPDWFLALKTAVAEAQRIFNESEVKQ